MKNTGMTRALDSLGRIVIPKEMRRSMDTGVGDPLELYVDAETGFLSMCKYTRVSEPARQEKRTHQPLHILTRRLAVGRSANGTL
ncbi:AbrB/MazE/SpoVT family DNA-binding domain-containing protein [Paenibacillus sp. UY79]|nr:AbrB/MazE/SpoVT family DNA-binding domain-containing protein [Paenibacillus farraposensis]